MKFGKLLQDFSRADLEKEACSEPGGPSKKRQKLEDPEIRTDREFLKYKQMKKLLKKASELKEEGDDVGMRGVEKEFIRVLHDDVDRINSYFMEVEEDCVIKLQCLRDAYEEECIKKNNNKEEEMSQGRLSMRKTEEILRLKDEAGLSHRAIARSCSVSPSTVSEYVTHAKAAPDLTFGTAGPPNRSD